MVARVPLVLGADGIAQQLQPADSVAAALGFSSGSNANGKWRLAPDGALEQTGLVTLANGVATITFPIKFPTICDFVALTPIASSTAATDISVYQTADPPTQTSVAIGGSVTQVGLNAAVAAASFKVRWRATGS